MLCDRVCCVFGCALSDENCGVFVGVLAFDLGGTIGWSFVDDDGAVADFGEQKLTSKNSVRGTRFLRLKKLATELVIQLEPDYMIYERPFHQGLDATRCLWGYAAVLELVAEEQGIASIDELPGKIKAFALGPKPGSGKDKMIAAAEKRVGAFDLNEHESDAIWLGLYAHATVEFGEKND